MTAGPTLDGRAAPVDIRGSTVPRIFTPPRWAGPPGPCGCGCALRPATSRGFEVIDFATDVLRVALLPWQRWWLIHAFELSLDVHPLAGRRRLRFRTLLTLIARQQGKSWIMRVVALWALYVRRAGLVLGAAQSLDIAREAWLGAVDMAQSSPETRGRDPGPGRHPADQRRAVPHPVRRAALPDRGGHPRRRARPECGRAAPRRIARAS